jgi:hypothetical protein
MKRLICRAGIAAIGLAFAGIVSADEQYYTTIEDAARLTELNEVKFRSDSVTRQQNMVRFDLEVSWKNPATRPETEAPGRIMRYLAKCDSKEVAVMAVAVFDNTRRLVKSFGIAPGGWDFMTPATDTTEGQSMVKACAKGL